MATGGQTDGWKEFNMRSAGLPTRLKPFITDKKGFQLR
jgi:hypothetical protein